MDSLQNIDLVPEHAVSVILVALAGEQGSDWSCQALS